MNNIKTPILNNICYTNLVYGRINKKLGISKSEEEIESFMMDIIRETEEENFQKIGKNFYISNAEKKIRITVNSNTFRVITVDKLNNK